MNDTTTAVPAALEALQPLLSLSADELAADDVKHTARTAFRHFLQLLEGGHVRAASRNDAGICVVNPVV